MTRPMIRRTAFSVVSLGACLPLLLGACSKSTDTATTEQPSTTTTAAGGAINAGPTIEIPGLSFSPPAATAKVGQVVTWKNVSSGTHQVEAIAVDGSTPAFQSELMKVDQEYVFTPTAAGTFDYHCRIHPNDMKGTLTVTQ